jgi:predicted GNAT family acetyltransferase
MTTEANDVRVVHNERDHRFEVALGAGVAFTEYQRSGRTMIISHTEVPPEMQGQGIAQRIAREALEHARAAGLAVVPTCPFVRAYIARHEEYQGLVKTGGY